MPTWRSSYGGAVDPDVPGYDADEREHLLSWLDWLRGAVLRKVDGVDERAARWRPDAKLIPLIGIVNHLTRVEWRWIDGGMLGLPYERHESEFFPGPELTVAHAVAAYRARAEATGRVVRSRSLDAPCLRREGTTLRWVLLHLINETARHAGHADCVRELLDGVTGE